MAAYEQGYKRGFDYLQGHKIEAMTFEEYCKLGKVVAKHDYQRDKQREQFALGWWQSGEKFITMYKSDEQDRWQTQQLVALIQRHLDAASNELNGMVESHTSDTALRMYLDTASGELDNVQETLVRATEYLKSPKEV